MFDTVNYPDFVSDEERKDGDARPPVSGSSKGESARCDWCDRVAVSRSGGFCKSWEQIFGCPHQTEAEAHIMNDI